MKTLTVGELIKILKKHDPKLPVVLTYNDHTDWRYVAPVLKTTIEIQGNEDEEDGVRDDNGFGIDGPALVIDFPIVDSEDEEE